jgi:hypothetical protein
LGVSRGEQTWVPKRDEGRRAVRRARGKMRTSRPLPRVSSSSRRAIAPRRATHDSSCVSCRSKCPREPTSTALNGGPRAPVRIDRAKRMSPERIVDRNLHHTTDTRAMSSATKPRRSINGGKSPSYGRDHSPPPGREMAVKNHRRGTRHRPSPPTVLDRVLLSTAIFPPKPRAMRAPPMMPHDAPCPRAYPLTIAFLPRVRPLVRVRRRSHGGRR